MPTNDIKAFAAAGGANVLTQAEYIALAALSTGFTSGKANAKEVNKALRQSSFVAAAIAQFISDTANVDVIDNGNVSELVAKLTEAISSHSLTRSSPFADIKSDGTGGTARNNLDLKSAALRDVGSGANQIPDMALFGVLMGQSGYQKLPSGMIFQWGTAAFDANGNAFAALPITYPNAIHGGIASEAAPVGWAANVFVGCAVDLSSGSRTGVTIRGRVVSGTSGVTNSTATLSTRFLVWGN